MSKKYKLIDVFSGIGGLHIGFENSQRFITKLALDFNADCELFHKVNLPITPFERIDLSKIDEEEFYKQRKIESIDILIGGPPCQGFSTIGKRASSCSNKRDKYDIRNNNLIGHYINHVRVLRPKFFFAAFLLKNNYEYNISDISDMTGFSSPRYFSTCFRNSYKLSPSKYRKEEERNH